MNSVQERLELIQSFGPDYYDDDPIMTNIYEIQAKGLMDYEQEKEDVFLQFDPRTATWGIHLWERELGLEIINIDPIELRRARVLTKLSGFGSFTEFEADRLANIYSNPKTAEYKGVLNEYAFKTKFQLNHLIDFAGMIRAFEEMKPAHLEHIVELGVEEELIIEDVVSYKLKTYHKVHEFRVGMTPIKYMEGEVLP